MMRADLADALPRLFMARRAVAEYQRLIRNTNCPRSVLRLMRASVVRCTRHYAATLPPREREELEHLAKRFDQLHTRRTISQLEIALQEAR